MPSTFNNFHLHTFGNLHLACKYIFTQPTTSFAHNYLIPNFRRAMDSSTTSPGFWDWLRVLEALSSTAWQRCPWPWWTCP